SSAYFEGTWVWTADHDLDATTSPQTSIFNARSILSESTAPVWFTGTALEHATLYQYNLANAQNHYIGFAQTETPYYQPVPAAPAPFDSASSSISNLDPTFSESVNMGWAMMRSPRRTSSSSVLDSTVPSNLSTVGVTYQPSVGGRGVVSTSDNQNGFQDTTRNDRQTFTIADRALAQAESQTRSLNLYSGGGGGAFPFLA
ncbi:hypothetical protein BU15DRAFT_67866, partial [Melanogaster broomeanus]